MLSGPDSSGVSMLLANRGGEGQSTDTNKAHKIKMGGFFRIGLFQLFTHKFYRRFFSKAICNFRLSGCWFTGASYPYDRWLLLVFFGIMLPVLLEWSVC